MRILVNKYGADDPDGIDEALQRTGRIAFVLSLTVLGFAGMYFVALCLIAR